MTLVRDVVQIPFLTLDGEGECNGYDADESTSPLKKVGGTGMVVSKLHIGRPVVMKTPLTIDNGRTMAYELIVYDFLGKHRSIAEVIGYSDAKCSTDGIAIVMHRYRDCMDDAIHFGGRLLDYILPDEEASLDCIVQVCEAVAHLHAHGIAHCDIRPCNILYEFASDHKTRFYLTDFTHAMPFGVSFSESYRDARKVLSHLSPDGRATEFLDVFSVGVFMHNILYGTSVNDMDEFRLTTLRNPKPRQVFKNLEVVRGMVSLIWECTLPSPRRRPNVQTVIDRLGILRI
jgi:serine/threonine protein kinase